jgi:hypothetical protein
MSYLVLWKGMPMQELDVLITEVNLALEAGEWAQVVGLTAQLYGCALAAGESTLAELVQDLHWIANDALVHPITVPAMLSDVQV